MDLNKLTPEQQAAVINNMQQQVQQQQLQDLVQKVTDKCFKKCAGTSVSATMAKGRRERWKEEMTSEARWTVKWGREGEDGGVEASGKKPFLEKDRVHSFS